MALDAATLVERLSTALRSLGLRPEQLPPGEVFGILRALGIEVDTGQVDRDLSIAVDRIRRSVATGRAPDRALIEQAAQTLTSRLGQSVRSTGKRIIESYALMRTATADPETTGPKARYVWLAVMDGRSCPSCRERHGAVRTLQVWDVDGRPGSEVLFCQENCRCQLWPVQTAGKDVVLQDGLPGGREAEQDAELAVEELLVRLEDLGVAGEVRVGRDQVLAREGIDIEGLIRGIFGR